MFLEIFTLRLEEMPKDLCGYTQNFLVISISSLGRVLHSIFSGMSNRNKL